MKTNRVKQWVASSQQDLPVELDFHTPFKEMASRRAERGPRVRAEVYDKQAKAAGSNDKAITISSRESSSATSSSASQSTEQYEKQPRHRTKEDRYEYKGDRHRRRRQSDEKAKNVKKQKRYHRKTGGNIGGRFIARNVVPERLTIKKQKGLFNNGRASVPIRRSGLPDLAFSEKAFLNLNRFATENGSVTPDENGAEPREVAGRRDKRREDKEAEISRYFQAPLAEGANSGGGNYKKRGTSQYLYKMETPCRQKRNPSELSSDALAGVHLPGPPYLGFGERGPRLVSMIPPGRNARLPKRQSFPLQEKMINSANPETADAPASQTSIEKSSQVSALDPRAQHSPMSNYHFARRQNDRLATLRRVEDDGEKQNPVCHEDKQEEILRLLRELKSNHEEKSRSPQQSEDKGQGRDQDMDESNTARNPESLGEDHEPSDGPEAAEHHGLKNLLDVLSQKLEYVQSIGSDTKLVSTISDAVLICRAVCGQKGKCFSGRGSPTLEDSSMEMRPHKSPTLANRAGHQIGENQQTDGRPMRSVSHENVSSESISLGQGLSQNHDAGLKYNQEPSPEHQSSKEQAHLSGNNGTCRPISVATKATFGSHGTDARPQPQASVDNLPCFGATRPMSRAPPGGFNSQPRPVSYGFGAAIYERQAQQMAQVSFSSLHGLDYLGFAIAEGNGNPISRTYGTPLPAFVSEPRKQYLSPVPKTSGWRRDPDVHGYACLQKADLYESIEPSSIAASPRKRIVESAKGDLDDRKGSTAFQDETIDRSMFSGPGLATYTTDEYAMADEKPSGDAECMVTDEFGLHPTYHIEPSLDHCNEFAGFWRPNVLY